MGDIKVTVVEIFYDRREDVQAIAYGMGGFSALHPHLMGVTPPVRQIVHKNVIDVTIDESDYHALDQALSEKSTVYREFIVCRSFGEDRVLGELYKFKKLKQISQYNQLVNVYNEMKSYRDDLEVTLKKCKSAKRAAIIKQNIEEYNSRLEDAFNKMSAHPLFRDEKCENGYYLMRHAGDY